MDQVLIVAENIISQLVAKFKLQLIAQHLKKTTLYNVLEEVVPVILKDRFFDESDRTLYKKSKTMILDYITENIVYIKEHNQFIKTYSQFLFEKEADTTVSENDDFYKSGISSSLLGLKQVRIVISSPDDAVARNSDKILKILKKLDPSSKCEYYPKTGKIVGFFAKVKIDSIKRDLKSIDPEINIEIKKQNLK